MGKKKLDVIYEDNHLVIVNKPAGELSQGDKTGDSPFSEKVKEYIKVKYEKPGAVFLGTIHRLDRPVSGLMIFARTSKGLERMNKLFRERKIKKTYWAVTRRRPPQKEDKLVNWLMKDGATNTVTVFDHQVEGAQKAELKYKYIGTVNLHHLIEVVPLTGRPHQIRAQLSHIGCPIRGDAKYGYARPNSDKSINLHSRRVDFIHPIKKEPVICVAGLPNNQFWEEFLSLEDAANKLKNMDFLHE